MRINESRIRQIIREEARRVLCESSDYDDGDFDPEYEASEADRERREWGEEDDESEEYDEFDGDDAARRHFNRDFDPDSDDEYEAIKDYAAVTDRDKVDVLHDRMSGKLGRRGRGGEMPWWLGGGTSRWRR